MILWAEEAEIKPLRWIADIVIFVVIAGCGLLRTPTGYVVKPSEAYRYQVEDSEKRR